MLKKIIIGILAMTLISAAVAAAAYNLGKKQNVPVVAEETFTARDTPINNPESSNAPHDASPQAQSEEMMGEPFTALAQIRAFDSTGINVVFETGETAYVELGPEDYWRSQSVELRETDIITIEGHVMEDMYHASSVITNDGSVLALRTEDGQPLWSGGISAGQAQDDSHSPDSQVAPEEWITYTGMLTGIRNGSMTIALEDGQTLSFRTGQPRFFQSQGVVFSINESVEVTGYYTGSNFSAGDITQLSTGTRVMLLDPNGRPLWAGPGNGAGGGN